MLRLLDERSPVARFAALVPLPHTIATALVYLLAVLLFQYARSHATAVLFVVLGTCCAAVQLVNVALFALQEWRGPFLTPALRARQHHVRRLSTIVDMLLCNIVAYAFLTQSLWVMDKSATRDHFYQFDPVPPTQNAWHAAIYFLTSGGFTGTGMGFYPVKPAAPVSNALTGAFGMFSKLIELAVLALLVQELFGERRRRLFEQGWEAVERGQDVAIPLVQTPPAGFVVASERAVFVQHHQRCAQTPTLFEP